MNRPETATFRVVSRNHDSRCFRWLGRVEGSVLFLFSFENRSKPLITVTHSLPCLVSESVSKPDGQMFICLVCVLNSIFVITQEDIFFINSNKSFGFVSKSQLLRRTCRRLMRRECGVPTLNKVFKRHLPYILHVADARLFFRMRARCTVSLDML